MRLIYYEKLPGLNEIIKACKESNCRRNVYGGLKGRYTSVLMASTKKQTKESFDKQVNLSFTWYCKDRKRDKDNIMGGGQKILIDALVHAGIIKNDTWEFIGDISHKFIHDPQGPWRVVVDIEEVS